MNCLTLGPVVFDSPAMLLLFAVLIGAVTGVLVARQLRAKCVYNVNVMPFDKELLTDFLGSPEGAEIVKKHVQARRNDSA